MLKDHRVRVYNDDDSINATWTIKSRTEQQADSEAMSEVEQHYSGLDWTICEKAAERVTLNPSTT